jgi:hypothetical protein
MSTKTTINKEIITTYLSAQRLEQYIVLANGDFDEAIELYIKNKQISASLQFLLNELEVILRNSINNLLTIEIGADWLTSAHLKPQQAEIVNSVIAALMHDGKSITNSNIISNLSFGFWVYLFNAVYDKSLWRQNLHKIFTNKPANFKRSKARLELHKFKNLRNRTAHCEYILKYPYEKYPQEIIEFISWIHPDMAKWVKEVCKYGN